MYYLWNENEIPLINKENPVCLPSITPYIKEGAKAAVVVCPGGGYTGKAPHEGGPIAEYLNDCGLSAFVLDYRVAPYRYPCELLDAKRAIRYVRYNAEKFGIDAMPTLLFFRRGELVDQAVGSMEREQLFACLAALLYQ